MTTIGRYAQELLCLAMVCTIMATTADSSAARNKSRPHTRPSASPQSSAKQTEAATLLQVFLDRSNFSPGPINGRYNDLTIKALALYRQARGEPASAEPLPPNAPPNVNGLDFGRVGPATVPYTVAPADLQNVGPLPSSVAAQAKLKFLPYHDAAEAIAEKFHCDVHFLEFLNRGKTKSIKPGDHLNVPNVQPFELASVKDLKVGADVPSAVANDIEDQNQPPDDNSNKPPGPTATSPLPISVKVDTKTNMLGVFEGDKLAAAYPVTVGSAQTASPIGEWKVRGVAKLPRFRYDKQMLKHGERSRNFQMLPPGPNSPVGLVWIALNKKGIGLHGTDSPETIGRAASHGCIRLANWDIVRLAQMVKGGVPVSIH